MGCELMAFSIEDFVSEFFLFLIFVIEGSWRFVVMGIWNFMSENV